MDNASARDDLAGRYERLTAEGLADAKFLLRNKGEATIEKLCREVAALHAAVDRGDATPLDFGDRTIQ